MHPTDRRQFRQDFWTTALGTLASRVLGMLRDWATAGLLGLAAGGVMDAFALAFRLANVFRRLLGEGALATSYLPVFSAELERDRGSALALAGAVLRRLAIVLALLVLAGGALCGLIASTCGAGDGRLLAGLLAAMLPYLLFICLAAQISATLQALGNFRLPALTASTLNLVWLAGAWFLAPHLAATAVGRAYVLAGAIVAAGALQVALGWLALGRLAGNTARSDQPLSPDASRLAWRKIIGPMGPIALALSVTQLSTLVDSSLAWLLTRPVDGPDLIAWLPGAVTYPLRAGATAALYYAERFYQLPVGLLGVAAATVIFPQLSRHVARGDRCALAGDLSAGLRLIACLSLPAAVGLVLLAEPLARGVLGHGAFSAADVARTAATTRAYAAGVVAYCTLPLILRGFYAVGDARRPLVAGVVALAINTLLDLTLAWPLGESGLALATAVSSFVQLAILVASFSRVHAALDWLGIGRGLAKATLATAALAGAVMLTRPGAAAGTATIALELTCATLAGGAAFFAVLWFLGSDELAIIWPAATRQQPTIAIEPQQRAGRSAA